MESLTEIALIFSILVISFLYASVGHGGASGYLALMIIFGISPIVMRPSALTLNIFVSAVAFIQYNRAQHFHFRSLLPFILLSIPASFAGAMVHVDSGLYKLILACCLLIATMRILLRFPVDTTPEVKAIPFIPALLIGAVIGFISGLVGIGGGILLSPVLILCRWADMKQTAALSAAFIFLNSVAGLAGNAFTVSSFPPVLWIWTVVALAGGLAGGYFGSHRFNLQTLKHFLAVVLIFACVKLVIG